MATCLNLLSGGSIILISLNGIFPWRLHCQKDAKTFDKPIRNWMDKKVQELAGKLNISKPIELIEVPGLFATDAQAQGIAILKGRAGIAIDSPPKKDISEEEVEEEIDVEQTYNNLAETEFILAHELAHIKGNDVLWMGIAPAIIGAITTLAVSILFPQSAIYFSPLVMSVVMISSPAAAIGLTVSILALIFFSRWLEERADKLGFSVCSPQAQEAASKVFEDLRLANIAHRNNEKGSFISKLWNKVLITKDGDTRWDVMHPSLKTRVNYLNLSYQQTLSQ